jgi:hypothetical protein
MLKWKMSVKEEFVKINFRDNLYNYYWTLYNMETIDSNFSGNFRIEAPGFGYVIGKFCIKRYIPD